MPVHKVKGGFRWGRHGKVYKTRAGAERQARAIYASGYRGDALDRRTQREVARALRANKRAELRYVRDLRGILNQIHRGFMRVLEPHVAARAPQVRHDVRSHDLDLAGVEVRMIHYIRQAVPPAFDRMAAAVDGTNEKAAERLHGIPLARTSTAAEIARFRDQNIRLVENAGRAYAAQVREVFDDPENYGLRVEDLAQKLEERGQVSSSRAELIARDQTLKLNAQLNESRQTSAGVKSYRWSGSLDERERPEHRALEGQIFDWDDPPVTNEEGDRNHPGEDFQCRCVAVPVVEELEGV